MFFFEFDSCINFDTSSVVEQDIVLLHRFIKKTQATPKRDLTLAKSRYRKYRTYYEK